MFKLSWWFTSDFELYRSEFTHPLLNEPAECFRGKTSHFHHQGTFQWTASLHALAILVLKSSAWTVSNGKPYSPVLEGYNGSAAASLCFALAKKSSWLLDMFGVDSNGESLTKRILNCSNSQMKLPGPARISFKIRDKASYNFKIYIDNTLVTDPIYLLTLAKRLGDSWKPQRNPKQTFLSNIELIDSKTSLIDLFLNETCQMLRDNTVFKIKTYVETVKKINACSLLRKFSDSSKVILAPLDLEFDISDRLGMVSEAGIFEKELKKEPTINCVLSLPQLSTIIIFYYLKNYKGYNIEVNYNFTNSYEIISKIKGRYFDKEPDLTAYGITSAVNFSNITNVKDYQPLMLMPKVSHKILSPKFKKRHKVSLNGCDYHFMHDPPTTSSLYLDNLTKAGIINRRRIKISNSVTDDLKNKISAGDEESRYITWFPHHCIYNFYGLTNSIKTNCNSKGDAETIMFVGGRLKRDLKRTNLLNLAIRNAWLKLAQDSNLLSEVLTKFLTETDYAKLALRSSGFDWDQMDLLPKAA